MNRRAFVAATSSALTAAILPPGLRPDSRAAIKAVLFDAFPIFDPRPVGALVTRLFPDRGPALLAEWRTRQFGYTWLRTAGRRYRDFWETTGQALASAARSVQLEITAAQRATLMEAFLHLEVWPDVPAGLQTLNSAGIRLGFLSNFTAEMLDANLASAGLRGQFDFILSTDRVRSFKPAPEAYQLGLAATGLAREEIAFAAFAGWDAAGAKWFGYPTVWVNRLGSVAEELDAVPDATGPDFEALLAFVARR